MKAKVSGGLLWYKSDERQKKIVAFLREIFFVARIDDKIFEFAI